MYGKFKTWLDAFWHSYIPPIVFLKIFFVVSKVSNSWIFQKRRFINYFTSDFHTNTVISSVFAYSSKWHGKPWQGLLEFANVGFLGEVPEYLEKNLWSKDENQQQTQPKYDAKSWNRTQVTLLGGECSHHCATAPSLIRCCEHYHFVH